MKKVFALLLTVVLLVSVLAACSSPLDDLSKKIQDLTNETSTATPTPTTTTEEPTTTITTEEPTTTEEPVTEESGSGVDAEYDQVLYDEGGILIEAVGTTWDDYYCNVELYIENNTDVDLTFSDDGIALEGIMMGAGNSYLYETVDANSKIYTNFKIDGDELLSYGVTDPTWIMFLLEVYERDTYSSDGYPYDYLCNIYPYGEEEALYHPYEATDDELVIVDDDNIMVLIDSYDVTDDGDFILYCILENKTANYQSFAEDNSSLNGFDVDGYGFKIILPYSIYKCGVRYTAEDLEEQHLDASSITEGTVGWNIHDADGNMIWSGTYDYTLN